MFIRSLRQPTDHYNLIRDLEILALLSLIIAVALAGLFGLHFYFPDMDSVGFVSRHYIGPLVPVTLGTILIPILREQTANPKTMIWSATRDIMMFFIIIFVHCNFKLWSRLINPISYDELYQYIDFQSNQLILLIDTINDIIDRFIPQTPHAYHDFFVAMFMISYSAHALQKRPEVFRKLLSSSALVLILGGLAYAVAPALGPFSLNNWGPDDTKIIQTDMLDFYSKFIESKGEIYAPNYFVAAVAAMPSLHVAHGFLFTWFALRYLRCLGLIYIPLLLFIIIKAVALRWHYVVDLAGGVLVALVCILLVEKVKFLSCPELNLRTMAIVEKKSAASERSYFNGCNRQGW